MEDMEVIAKNEYTAEQRAFKLRELAKRAELYRLKIPHPKDDFSFRAEYFEEAEEIIS